MKKKKKKKNGGDDEAENGHKTRPSFPTFMSYHNRSASEGYSSKDDEEFLDANSRPETVNQTDTGSEYDSKTGSEEWGEERGDQMAKPTANGLTEVWGTSSFVQKLLYEDSQTGVAVVDLFVALKSAKNSIDNLSNLNDSVQEKLVSLSHDTGLIEIGYENLIQTMAFFFDVLQKEESRIGKSEPEAGLAPTENSIPQPEVDIAREKSATEIGRFCSSCGFVKYLRENVICPLCKGEIIVREKCSDCVAVEQSEKKSICEYCGLPELRDKKTESNTVDEIEIRKETGNKENVKESCEEVETSAPEESEPSSPRPNSVAQSSGGSVPSQTSKVIESFFEMLMGHVFQSEEGSKSTTVTRESLLSSLLSSKSGIVLSQEDSKKISEGTISLSDSTVQMICEICGILGMIEPQEHPLENTSTALDKTPKSDEMEGGNSRPRKNVRGRQLPMVSDTRTNKERRNSIITIYVPDSTTTIPEDKEPEQSNEEQTGSRKIFQPETPETEGNCEEEVYEEALSEPYSGQTSRSTSRRVNCMGDKEETKASKSVNTFTATNDFVSSWIGKITEDIKTKLRNLKPRSRQISVTDEGTSGKVSKKLPPALEFTISANTPVGIFDVTIRQYKDIRRKLKDGPFCDVISDGAKIFPVEMKALRDGAVYWSDESLLLSESDHVDLVSSSGVIPLNATPLHSSGFLLEEEMEEFIEVYVQSRDKTSVSTSGFFSKREKGFIAEMILLHERPQFVEMVRCQPTSFIQEFVAKAGKFILKKGGRQKEEEVKEEGLIPQEEVNAGSMLVPGKGSGGKDNDEDRDSQDSGSSLNNSETVSRSFNDLVISIQIDVDDHEEAEECSGANNQIYIDLKVGGQDSQNFKGKERVYLISKKEIAQLGEGPKDEVKDIWKDNVLRSLEEERVMNKGRITFREAPIMIDKETEKSIGEDEDDQQEEVESKSFESTVSENSETKRMMKERSVTFRDEFSEEEIKDVKLDSEQEEEPKAKTLEEEPKAKILEEEPKAKTWATAYTFLPIQKPNQAEVHYLQSKRTNMLTLDPRTPTLTFFFKRTDNDLQNALDLIQEIETNVIKVKLSEAVLILPVLESELRKHLRDKMKGMTGRRSPSRETSLDNYFSAVEVMPSEEMTQSSSGSEERFQYLLKLLSDLEQAVKSNVYSKEQICEHSSSRIYNLLHALTNNIRGLEDDTTMSQISETVDIASQLDTAVRELDDIIKKKPTDYAKELIQGKTEDLVEDEEPMKEHLTSVRKRVFEMVEEDAIETEERIEMDFDRIDRLERENEESMKFVEAFLEKTLRRSAELTNLRTELKHLSSALGDLYEELSKAKQRKERSLTRPSRPPSPPTKEVPVRDTVSSLLLALDDLKTRAREKNEACKEILETIASATSIKRLTLDRQSLMSSNSSYATKSTEGVMSSVTEFKKIGQRSLYLAWSKPEGDLSGSITGYEILVNGKLNQKVRNPQRQQAVLYSVDLSHSAEVQLFGLLDNGSKFLLAIVTYLNL